MTEKNGQRVAYVNGEFVSEERAVISIFDHGLLYGDGVYDTLCGWNGAIFRLEQHVDRLYRSAQTFHLDVGIDPDGMAEAIVEVAARNGEENQYLKCILTRGVGERPLLTPIGCKPTTIVFSAPEIWLWGGAKEEKGHVAVIVSTRCIPPQCLDAKAKNLNYACFVMAKMEALVAGVDQAVMLDIDGFVNECPGYNIFVVGDGRIVTPPREAILEGVTRDTVFEIAADLGIEVLEARLTPHDLYNGSEVFLSSTAGGLIPIVQIDGRTISSGQPGDVFSTIHEAYMTMLRNGVHGTPFLEADDT